MDPIIKVQNLSKKYKIRNLSGGYITLRDSLGQILRHPFRFFINKTKQALGRSVREEFWALQDINFEIKKGEVVGIIGKNGAGKSTLLKILSRITPPTTGEIHLRGRVASLLEVGTGFHSELTGRENIFLNGSILGMSKLEINRKFDQIVDFAGIGKFLDTPVRFYSSGMSVRLAFSIAAHMEPDVLIIDEVLAVGDAEFQKKCLGKMEEVTKKEGRTILFVSHNMSAVRSLCTSCILLEGGRMKSFGETNKIIADYALSNSKVATATIAPHQHIQGGRQASIVAAEISGAGNYPSASFAINEPISIKIDYEVKLINGDFSFWALFIDENGQPLVSSFQKDSGQDLIKPILGRHQLLMKMTEPGLLPGRYSVSLGILIHDNYSVHWEYADWADSCFTINVNREFFNGRRFENRPGAVERKADWLPLK